MSREIATANYESAGKFFSEDGAVPEAGQQLIIEEAKKAGKINAKWR